VVVGVRNALGPHDQCGPQQVGVCWYGVRVWIKLGFWALKGVGWQWHHTRRTAPARVARHWLVLAVAMLGSLAFGTRAEDAEAPGYTPRTAGAAAGRPAAQDAAPGSMSFAEGSTGGDTRSLAGLCGGDSGGVQTPGLRPPRT
jgi:hypothetical protein